MPIYVFRCTDGHRFESLIPMAATAPNCPSCDRPARKVPTTVGLGGGRTGSRPTPDTFTPDRLWREAFAGRPEKVKRELEFRERLSRSGTRESPSPDRNLKSL